MVLIVPWRTQFCCLRSVVLGWEVWVSWFVISCEVACGHCMLLV